MAQMQLHPDFPLRQPARQEPVAAANADRDHKPSVLDQAIPCTGARNHDAVEPLLRGGAVSG